MTRYTARCWQDMTCNMILNICPVERRPTSTPYISVPYIYNSLNPTGTGTGGPGTSSSSLGAIVGGAVGGVAFLAGLALTACFCLGLACFAKKAPPAASTTTFTDVTINVNPATSSAPAVATTPVEISKA